MVTEEEIGVGEGESKGGGWSENVGEQLKKMVINVLFLVEEMSEMKWHYENIFG